MPDHLAPGVYVEETRFRTPSIEGVGTSTTAFIGPTLFGPVQEKPELLTQFEEFRRIYGSIPGNMDSKGPISCFAQSIRAYFQEGGQRLYVSRVFPVSGATFPPNPLRQPPEPGNPRLATAIVPAGNGVTSRPIGFFQARFPGKALEGSLSIRTVASPSSVAEAVQTPPGTLFRITQTPKAGVKKKPVPKYFLRESSGFKGTHSNSSFPTSDAGITIEILALSVEVTEASGRVLATYTDLGFHPVHPRYLGTVLARDQVDRINHLNTPYAFVARPRVTAFQLRQAFDGPPRTFSLQGAEEPPLTPSAYEAALSWVEGLSDVSTVAAPGYTKVDPNIASSLVAHCEKPNAYRLAVLDVPQGSSPSEARQFKESIDSKNAALYYPWVVVANPEFNATLPSSEPELLLPPSGFICGIYARTDAERGVHKAPANEVVRSAVRFERPITTAEQEMLNPLGINCLRFLTGRGHRVWGARTTSSDPEWKYVNLRRYFNYLEQSIHQGTQWVVFEPNAEPLWTSIRGSVSGFLLNEWQRGALLGSKPEQAFFVQCDRGTMSQNDLDQGRLVCLIGVAALKPAEFVIFRIGRRTAHSIG